MTARRDRRAASQGVSGVVAVVFEPGPERVLARVSGEIDTDDAAELREDFNAALAASHGGLDVDLAAVTFCDSSGLRVLLDVNQLARQAGKSLVLTALSRPVARLLRITEAQRVLTVHSWPPETSQGFQMNMRRYGPAVHLAPAGELDLDTRSALDEVHAALQGVDLVACDMCDLTFLDVLGLHGLLDLVRGLDSRGIAFFAYNWQQQPRRLLDLVDDLHPPTADNREEPTRLLRRLRDSAAAARAAGAAKARDDVPRRAALPPY